MSRRIGWLSANTGDSHFLQRFALQAHGSFDAAESMKSALEPQNPLIAGAIRGGGDYPEQSFSRVSIAEPSVLQWALKPAEEGIDRGIIARVWNLRRVAGKFVLRLRAGLKATKRVSHIETDLEDAVISGVGVSPDIAESQLLTFRLLPAAGGR